MFALLLVLCGLISTRSSLAFTPPLRTKTTNLPTRWQQQLYPAAILAAAAASHNGDDDANPTTIPLVSAEVVGGAGRIGSLFLASTGSRAVPRGIAPGCLSPNGAPIFVAAPAATWAHILHDTLPDRRGDLVWIGNGLPPYSYGGDDEEYDCTVVVPHFGVLQVQAEPVTSPESPNTFLYGKHASAVEAILRDNGIRKIETVTQYSDIVVAAAQKLLWAASMWLLCHSVVKESDDKAMTALEVHTSLAGELDALVRQELFPALCTLLPQSFSNTPQNCDDALNYLHRYSKSMPEAVPKKSSCLAEWKERNAFFLQARETVPQPLHEALLQRVGGIFEDDISNATATTTTTRHDRVAIPIPDLGLNFVGTKAPFRGSTTMKSAIVVGGGILGSSVALHLARQGIITQVTVVDLQSYNELGRTTPASWAWLNANGKSPPLYAWLNQLGMDGWRRDPVLSKLPTWSGSLVRFGEPQSIMGGYRYEGPLEAARLQELEPAANLQDKTEGVSESSTAATYTYYYPDEGLVDPSKAVAVVRQEAAYLGVRFLEHCNVTAFTRDTEKGSITGVSILDANGKVSTMKADVVVLAAGTGSADLGKIPLLYRPGRIAFANPANKEKGTSLQRIIVDTVQESHILQREDGTIVVGGGALELGGSTGGALASKGLSRECSEPSDSSPLLGVAQQIVPGVIGELSRTEQANRPIPLDGLPAVGFIESGLYAVVTHSGMTLAPILAALAASELSQQVCIETLEPLRPLRFF